MWFQENYKHSKPIVFETDACILQEFEVNDEHYLIMGFSQPKNNIGIFVS
jgi:hypothetical protein